jgi:hypothetical protein
MKIDCQYATRSRARGPIHCSLGWFGGWPYLGNCVQCQAKKLNTPEAKAAFDAKAEAAHPGHRPRISGCCDRADQH